MQAEIAHYLNQINLPDPDSHKGQNGKLLVIGGSELFHSSIFWAADVASRIVDMVHFTSPANENNELVRKKIKEGFWTGIVVDWLQVASYIEEDDCVLIGPGMERSAETRSVVNRLLTKFPDKRWVVDGGALQMVDPRLLTKSCLITPHQHELEQAAANYLIDAQKPRHVEPTIEVGHAELVSASTKDVAIDRLIKQGVTILLKGKVDQAIAQDRKLEIEGGNSGMTKGGTGDVLAGLVAALYCQHDALTASVVASFVNKKAAEELWQSVGPFFNAGDLVEQVSKTLWNIVEKSQSNR